MRENRTSGSEGGEAQINELSLPLSLCQGPMSVCGCSGGGLYESNVVLQLNRDGASLRELYLLPLLQEPDQSTGGRTGHSTDPGSLPATRNRSNTGSRDRSFGGRAGHLTCLASLALHRAVLTGGIQFLTFGR